MFSMSTQIEPKLERVKNAADDAAFRNMRHAAFSIRKIAAQSIKKTEEPSSPGEPVTTRGARGANVKASIFTDADKESAIIGPRASRVGDVMEAHEFGKSRKGDSFDERPTMGPALEAAAPRFAADWAGSIGE